jgi:hypothetical protein
VRIKTWYGGEVPQFGSLNRCNNSPRISHKEH